MDYTITIAVVIIMMIITTIALYYIFTKPVASTTPTDTTSPAGTSTALPCTPTACTPVACTPVAATPVACTPVACTTAPIPIKTPAGPIILPAGTTIFCKTGDFKASPNKAAYRVISPSSVSWYPSTDIANSWDTKFATKTDDNTIDCSSGITLASDMAHK